MRDPIFWGVVGAYAVAAAILITGNWFGVTF
jgi:hypothetical protein